MSDALKQALREVRILRQKLARCQENRARLEAYRDRSDVLYRRVIGEMSEKEGQLKVSEERAQRASVVKSEFLANVSHEIRTPMNGVVGLTALLLQTPLTPRQRRFVEQVARSGESLMQLIDDVLDFSKIEAGRLELECIEFDLHEVAQDAIMPLAEVAFNKGVELVCDVARCARVRGDPHRLRQILTNLLSNAVKFTESGTVRLRVELSASGVGNGWLRVVVQDTGVGFDEIAGSHLFAPFRQADGTTTRKFGGTGLGLAIVRELTSLMGGSVRAEAELGVGATFCAELPVEVVDLPLIAAAESSTSINVLLFSRHSQQREAIAGLLGNLGVRCQVCTELRQLTCPGFDALVIDAAPTPQLRLLIAQSSTPTVLVAPSSAGVEAFAELGAEVVVSKPPRMSELGGALESLAVGRAVRAPRHTPTLPLRDFEGLRILVAEDNDINREVAQGLLESLGCEVVAVLDGSDAVVHAARGGIDLVLMDCQMPTMDGFEATRVIRGLPGAAASLPIVALTANVLRKERERCLNVGMNDFLSKPFTLAQLQALLRKWAGPQRAGRNRHPRRAV